MWTAYDQNARYMRSFMYFGQPHRMPPKTYTNVIILLQNLCFLQLECRQKRLQMSNVIILLQTLCFFKHGLKDCIKWSFHVNNLYKSNLMRGHCAQSALGMHAVDRVMFEGSATIEKMQKTLQNTCFKRKFLKCPQSLRECCAIKTVCTFCAKAVGNADFQLNFGFGLWWLHFFRLRCLLVQSHSSMYLSSWISNP